MERILGVNLSGWFIPEPWVTPSLYAATGASNAAELQEAMGTAAYNERMRRHYETFVSEDDFRRMAQIGLNAVRLPVPWYAFGSQESDASYISVVDYIDRAIEWAAKYDIRVLLDLATRPGRDHGIDRRVADIKPPPLDDPRIYKSANAPPHVIPANRAASSGSPP